MASTGYGTNYKLQGKWVAKDKDDARFSGEPTKIEVDDASAPKVSYETAGEAYYPQTLHSWHNRSLGWEIGDEIFSLNVLDGPGRLEHPYQKYVTIEDTKTRSTKKYKLVEITEEEYEDHREWYKSVEDQIWCEDSRWESLPTRDRINNTDVNSLSADEGGFVIDGSSLYRYDESVGGPIVNIPEGVKRIKARAFLKCQTIKEVNIPSSVKSIGDGCFRGCKNLERVRLPEGLTLIGNELFCDCVSLKEINLPDTLTSIGKDCFMSCEGLEEVTLPEAVTVIGHRAFHGAKGLRKIALNSALKKIEFAALAHCPSLTDLYIPASVEDIDAWAFDRCHGLESISVDEDNERYYAKNNCLIDRLGNILVLACDNSVIPDDGSVEIIGRRAFSNCKKIENIIVPETVDCIKEEAFEGCSSLKTIKLPTELKRGYGSCLFNGCSSLESLEIPSWMNIISQDMFGGCQSLKEIKIPDHLTAIEPRAFSGCKSLTELVIPKSVTKIGKSWMEPGTGDFISDCSSLRRLEVEDGNPVYHSVDNCIIETNRRRLLAITENGVIPNDGSVSEIGENAFCACENLDEIILPESITTIGKMAFSKVKNLRKINIPKSLKHIGSYAFIDVNSRNTHDAIEEDGGVYYLGDWALGMVKRIEVIEGRQRPMTVEVLPESRKVTIREGTVGICENAFFYSKIANIYLPNSLKYICPNAFFGCHDLKSVSIPEGVEMIGKHAFNDCPGLETVDLKEGLISIGEGAFNGCKRLESVTIPRTVEQIEEDAFAYCKGLKSLKIPDIEIRIDRDAFGYCGEIENIDVPERILAKLSHFGTADVDDEYGYDGYDGYDGDMETKTKDQDIEVSNIFGNCDDLPF